MISACQLTPPNVEICVGLEAGAYCQWTLDDKERVIPDEIWKTMQLGRFSMDAAAFGEYQKFVESACEVTKCSKKERRVQKKVLNVLEMFDETN